MDEQPDEILLPKLSVIELDSISELDADNPNAMSDAKFERLKTNIRKHGFLQPVLVYPHGDGYMLVDGWHRIKAMRELGAAQITACIADSLEDAQQIQPRLTRMSMNLVRGEGSYELLSNELRSLMEEGVAMDDLPEVGLEREDIDAMLAASSIDLDEIMANLDTNEPEEPAEGPEQGEKKHRVFFEFGSAKIKSRVEDALDELCGANNCTRERALWDALGIDDTMA